MRTILAIDFDKNAAATYKANFPDTDVRCGKVEEFVGSMPYADLVVAGFPCQPHSIAGKRKASSDERDGGQGFVDAVRKVQPRHFLGENVPGLLTSEGGKYWNWLYAALESTGYVLQYRVLDAVDFGVPQFRSRLWIWGIRRNVHASGIRHCWPRPTHAWPWPEPSLYGETLLPAVTVGQALNIPHRQWDGTWFRGGYAGDFARGAEGLIEIGPKQQQRIDEYERKSGCVESRELTPDEPSRTMTAKNAEGTTNDALRIVEVAPKHPFQQQQRPANTTTSGGRGHGRTGNSLKLRINTKRLRTGSEICEPVTTLACDSRHRIENDRKLVRRLTPLECARLMSMPDDFRWPEKISKTAMYKIIGNGQASAMVWHLRQAILKSDPNIRTTIDLFCGGGIGAVGLHGRFWKWEK